MQQPPWTAGPRLSFPLRAGGALGLSVLAHGLALAVLVQAMRHDAGILGASKQHGGMAVRLLGAPDRAAMHRMATTAPGSIPAPHPRAAAARTPGSSHALATHVAPAARSWADTVQATEPVPSAALPASQTSSAATSPSRADDTPAAPAEPAQPGTQTGSRFASLFAPLVNTPFGRGSWHSPPMRKPPEDAMAAMHREQAIAGIRLAVQRQTGSLQAQLQNQALQGQCDIRVSLERQAIGLRCATEPDMARLAAAFQGTLNLSADLTPQTGDTCLHAQDQSVSWTDCAGPPAP